MGGQSSTADRRDPSDPGVPGPLYLPASELASRQVCRIGITNKRLSYEEGGKNVHIEYNDYAKQVSGQSAPQAYRHLHPIEAMGQILQHLLPHHLPARPCLTGRQASTVRGTTDSTRPTPSLAPQLPDKVKREGATVRTIIEILRAMLKEEPYRCPYCQSDHSWKKGKSCRIVTTALVG